MPDSLLHGVLTTTMLHVNISIAGENFQLVLGSQLSGQALAICKALAVAGSSRPDIMQARLTPSNSLPSQESPTASSSGKGKLLVVLTGPGHLCA